MANRRRVFLLNYKFQLRFSFYMCSFLFGLSFVYPLILSRSVDYFISYLSTDPYGPSVAFLQKARQELMLSIVFMEAAFLVLTFMISIFLSHRIAGPLYKLRRFFVEARAGNLEQKLAFRKNDYFQELVGDYNSMMESIVGRMRKNNDAITRAIPNLERALSKAPPEMRSDLESTLFTLKNSQAN